MPKKTVQLDGLLNTQDRPTETGIPQRGAEPIVQPGTTALPSKRLSVVLDGATYKRLRLHAVETDKTHQDIIAAAVATYLGEQ